VYRKCGGKQGQDGKLYTTSLMMRGDEGWFFCRGRGFWFYGGRRDRVESKRIFHDGTICAVFLPTR
jgi:hypothetical protein